MIKFKYFIFLLIFQTSCSEKVDFIIDPNITDEVRENISKSIFGEDGSNNDILIYENNSYVEFVNSDGKTISTFQEPHKMIFKSWYYFEGDTLCIEGSFGLFGGIGFYAKVINNQATAYHMLASDDFPAYSYTEDGPIIDRLEVPCSENQLTLSSIPTSTSKEIIYGVTEFTSKEYYSGVSIANLERSNFTKMKIYFKSGYLNW